MTVYTWEGNAANISCEVLAHPGASVVWFRDGQQLSSTNTTNVKIYNTPAVSYLEVWYNRDMRAPKLCVEYVMNDITFLRMHSIQCNAKHCLVPA